MSALHILEVTLYSLLNFLPYLALAFFPFAQKCRFSKPVTTGIVLAATALQSFFFVWTDYYTQSAGAVLSLIVFAAFLLLYIFIVKEDIRKLLFVLLMVINTAYLVMVTAKCVEGFLFPALASQDKRWSCVLCTALSQAAFLPFYFVFLKKVFMPAAAVPASRSIWSAICLVPAVFYLFWYHDLYFSKGPEIQMMLHPTNSLFIILINAGSILIYTIVMRILVQSERNMMLRSQNHMLAMQNLQYESLKERIDDARHARHDLKHHIRLMSTMAEQGKFDELTAYLKNYIRTLPADTPLTYCKNTALNAVVSFYAQAAQEHGTDFKADIRLPEHLPVKDADLAVLFGNLLENACDACHVMPQGQPRHIRLRISMANDSAIVFTADNTFDGTLKRSKESGRLLSTKHSGDGIGLSSVESIVARYGGTVDIQTDSGLFQVSGVLNT